MRTNGEKDEFLFLEVEREGLVFILSKGRLITGELTLATMLTNIKQIIEVRQDRVGNSMVDDWVS